MRRRIVVSMAVLVLALSAVLSVSIGIGSADAAHRDLLINRMKTEFTSGQLEGDTVTFYGSGFWNTATGAVDIQGVAVLKGGDGGFIDRATWKATGVESFESFGTEGPIEGGVLVLDVLIRPENEPRLVVDDFTVVCLVGDVPPGFDEAVHIPSVGLDHTVHGPHRFTAFLQV